MTAQSNTAEAGSELTRRDAEAEARTKTPQELLAQAEERLLHIESEITLVESVQNRINEEFGVEAVHDVGAFRAELEQRFHGTLANLKERLDPQHASQEAVISEKSEEKMYEHLVDEVIAFYLHVDQRHQHLVAERQKLESMLHGDTVGVDGADGLEVGAKDMFNELIQQHHPDTGDGDGVMTRAILSARKMAIDGDTRALELLHDAKEDGTEHRGIAELCRRVLAYVGRNIEKYCSVNDDEPPLNHEVIQALLGENKNELSAFQQVGDELTKVKGEFTALARMNVKTLDELSVDSQDIQQEFDVEVQKLLGLFQAEAFQASESETDLQGALLEGLSKFVDLIKRKYKELAGFRLAVVPKQEVDDDDYDDEIFLSAQVGEESTEEEEVVVQAPVQAANDDVPQAQTSAPSDEDTAQDTTVELSPATTAVTNNVRRVEWWDKMQAGGFIKGGVTLNTQTGEHTLTIRSQALPACSGTRKEFFDQNLKEYNGEQDKNSSKFRTIKNPDTGEYFPEAVFLDSEAMDLFLDGRFEEYVQPEEYTTPSILDQRDANVGGDAKAA